MTDARAALIQHIKDDAVFHGDFTLTSGKKASYYIDLRKVSLDGRVAPLIGEVMVDLIADIPDIAAVGGLTMGADPIAAAVSALSWELGTPKPAFIVRKAAKEHGRKKRVEGPLQRGARVLVVEDVTTSGGSALDAIEALKAEADVTVAGVVSLVDRMQGAAERFAEAGYEFSPVFTAEELGVSREELEAEARSAEEGTDQPLS